MNSEVQQVLEQFIEAADSGEWHSSEDCEVEDRAQDCELCQALAKARALIAKYRGRGLIV